MNPWDMLFHPEKVPLKVFSIYRKYSKHTEQKEIKDYINYRLAKDSENATL